MGVRPEWQQQRAPDDQHGGKSVTATHFPFDWTRGLMVEYGGRGVRTPKGKAFASGSLVMNRRRTELLLAGCVFLLLALPLWAEQGEQNLAGTADTAEITIPEGTEFKLQLHTTISSKTSHPGDRILTTMIDSVAVEDRDVLPKGLRVDGHVGEVKAARHGGKGGYMSLIFDTVELPNGQKIAILGSLTEVFSSERGGDPSVGPEGDLKGSGPSRKAQLAIIAASTAAGAAGGLTTGVAAGVTGTALALTVPRGRQAALAAGSLIGMRLDRDVSFNPPSGGK